MDTKKKKSTKKEDATPLERKYYFVSWLAGMSPGQSVMDSNPLLRNEFISGQLKLNFMCEIGKEVYDAWDVYDSLIDSI